jgi:hypothetical protein
VPAPSRGAPPPSKVEASSSKPGPSKKMSVLKLVYSRAKTRVQGMSEIELALAKPVGISKIFCLLDVAAPSHGLRGAGITTVRPSERAARVAAFDNLGDDLWPDAHRTPSPKKAVEKSVASLPSMPG